MSRLVCILLVVLSSGQVWSQEKKPSLNVTAPDGFRVELIRAAQAGEDSWISLTFDDKGRILVGLDSAGVGRITYSAEDGTSQFEKVNSTLKHCRGVLYAYDSLYVSATNAPGFFRLLDTNKDDQFDEEELLFSLDYRSRYGHGGNQIKLGPDGMIYLVCGNDVSFPEGFATDSPYRNPHNDKLLIHDFDAGQDDRVGYILKLDQNGGLREILAGGFRNQVDIAFNADGEMFTYDADMEWDAGLPWYRPTRLNHVISGGEYGWRWGTMKWPTYYQDSLPTTLDTGYGSPTGMEFGDISHFPERYRQALYMADWQNGRIYVVDLIPEGATYRAEYNTFLQGAPLNVCDMTFGPDGAMWFVTGGRGSQAGLYRVSWTESAAEPELPEWLKQITPEQRLRGIQFRAARGQLEEFHRTQSPAAVDLAWHHLASEDRWLRTSARVALENQELQLWRTRALEESTPLGSMTALLALARVGTKADQPDLLAALNRQSLADKNEEVLLGLLRAYAITFARHGMPSAAERDAIEKRLNGIYPHSLVNANRELSELLVYLESPDVLDKTLKLLEAAPTQEEQVHYAMTLAHMKEGWTLTQRQQILNWLQQARRFPGGKLVDQAVKNLILSYRESLSEEEANSLSDLLTQLEQPLPETGPVVEYPVVKNWAMSDLLNALNDVTDQRSHEQGKRALAKASCLKCHRVGEEGGRIGPDLTQVGNRFDARALLESVLEPSKVIDEKYRQSSYILINGKVITGRPVGVSAKQITVETDPIQGLSEVVNRSEIEESVISQTSPMPASLVNILTREEILDLIAYLKYRKLE
ncbi:MAG: c-type cytochrome [Planctomycetaceae bacterium]|nr:c-type cytochrome [Planctomycetaceae bacterium]